MSHLVLKSMLVYVEVPMTSQLTMMALVVKGLSLTLAHHLKTHPLIPENTRELEVQARSLCNNPLSHGTTATSATHVQNPMLSYNLHSKHHGNQQQINLIAIFHFGTPSCQLS